MPPAKSQASAGSPRERLLAAANELFYAEGVHSVGIDRVIEHAGVAKASLYSSFGSKEELVAAYLEARAQRRQRLISERIAQHAEPRERILAIFDVLNQIVDEPGYRGCAFVNASAEGPRAEKIARVCSAGRAWVRNLFTELARELGVSEPPVIGRRLALLYDGVVVRAAMEREPGVAADARAIAEVLLERAQPATVKSTARKAATTKRRARQAPR